MNATSPPISRTFCRALSIHGLLAWGAVFAIAGSTHAVEGGWEAKRSAIVDLAARWCTAVAIQDPALTALVSSASQEHYRKLKHFALRADAGSLQDLHPTDQLQVLFFRSMLDPAKLQAMSPQQVLVFAVEQGMIGSDLRRSDELREVVVSGDSAQGRLYKFGRDDRADRGLQYFEYEDGKWRIDLRSELERLRVDFDAFVARSKLSADEAAFFILEARLARKVTPEDFLPPLGGAGEPTSPPDPARDDLHEDLKLRVVSIRESLDDPTLHAVTIEDRRESLRHVLRLGDVLPPAPRFVLARIQGDHAYLRSGTDLLTLQLEEDGDPLDTRLADVSPFGAAPRVSLLRQAELGVGREGLMAQWRNVGLRGRPQLLQQAWLNPVHHPDGHMLGLKVRTLVKGSFWHQIGLEENDLLKEFNGFRVDSTVTWREVLSSSETDLQIEIQVERSGRSMRFRTRTIRPVARTLPRLGTQRERASSPPGPHSRLPLG